MSVAFVDMVIILVVDDIIIILYMNMFDFMTRKHREVGVVGLLVLLLLLLLPM